MEQTLHADLAALQRMTASELRVRYAEVFGGQSPTWNRAWMLKRLAWRLQALAEGVRSERARGQAEELAQRFGDGDLTRADQFVEAQGQGHPPGHARRKPGEPWPGNRSRGPASGRGGPFA